MTKLDIIKKWFEGEEVQFFSSILNKWAEVIPYVERKKTDGTLPRCFLYGHDLRMKPKSKYMNLFENTLAYPHWVEGERETHPTDECIGYLLDKHGDGSDIIFVRESV